MRAGLLVAALLAAGCEWTRPYQDLPDKNLVIRNGSPDVRVLVAVNRVDASCNRGCGEMPQTAEQFRQMYKAPEGGYYRVVADAYPLPGNRTKVQWFGPSHGEDTLIRAIKSWASGENLGCPDFTKG